ncbi:hypothetical protein ACFSTC_00170 [Nonomuraea ferruginea]
MTRTDCPARSLPASRRLFSAVLPATGTAAASSKLSPPGMAARNFSGTRAYSA